jgi:BCD family chlorophyll transporter-like MFS transporter
MMIAGFAVTAGVAGQLLDPFSPARLVAVTTAVSIAALLLAFVAVRGVEGRGAPVAKSDGAAPKIPFSEALAAVWSEPQARWFTIFVFVSMLAYSLQDLILEPFAGAVFGYTPGESTKLAGVQHGGVLLGMIMVALGGSIPAVARRVALQAWTIGGCIASALALFALSSGAFAGTGWPLRPCVFLLGMANGTFAVAAIGSMMGLAGAGGPSREGIRMGLWGGAQAIAFGLGGFAGTAASDLARHVLGSPIAAYAVVFAGEGFLFLVAVALAMRVGHVRNAHDQPVRVRGRKPEFAEIRQGGAT